MLPLHLHTKSAYHRTRRTTIVPVASPSDLLSHRTTPAQAIHLPCSPSLIYPPSTLLSNISIKLPSILRYTCLYHLTTLHLSDYPMATLPCTSFTNSWSTVCFQFLLLISFYLGKKKFSLTYGRDEFTTP